MAESNDEHAGEIVPSSAPEPSHEMKELNAFGLSLRESDLPGTRQGLWKLLNFVGQVVRQLSISGVRYVYGKAEEPLAKVREVEAQTAVRLAENRRAEEKHAIEMLRLRLAAEKDASDVQAAKSFADAQELVRSQAVAEIERRLRELNRLGVEVSIVEAGPTMNEEDVLNIRLETLEISVRLRRALKRAAVSTIGDAVMLRESDVRAWKNFSTTGLNELAAILERFGLRLRQ